MPNKRPSRLLSFGTPPTQCLLELFVFFLFQILLCSPVSKLAISRQKHCNIKVPVISQKHVKNMWKKSIYWSYSKSEIHIVSIYCSYLAFVSLHFFLNIYDKYKIFWFSIPSINKDLNFHTTLLLRPLFISHSRESAQLNLKARISLITKSPDTEFFRPKHLTHYTLFIMFHKDNFKLKSIVLGTYKGFENVANRSFSYSLEKVLDS